MDLINKLKSIQIENILQDKDGISSLITIATDSSVGLAINLFRTYGISQLPVIDNDGNIVGDIDDKILIKALSCNIDINLCNVKQIMAPPMPILESTATAYDAYNYFLENKSSIIVSYEGKPKNILTRIDILNFFIKNSGDFEYLVFNFDI